MAETVYPAPGHSYAEPLSGLRVSWGSILAGTLATLAISLILWGLALAIVLTVTNTTVSSLEGSVFALWICAIVATVIGAFFGGMLGGWLPGNPRKSVAVIHAFLTWGLAFLLATVVEVSVIGGIARLGTNLVTSTTGSVVEATGAATGGEAPIQQKAHQFLTSLGYTSAEAQQMVTSAQTDIQRILRSGQSGGAGARVQGAFERALDWAAGFGWAWWGTWMIALGVMLLGGVVASRKLMRREVIEVEQQPSSRVSRTGPVIRRPVPGGAY